MIKRFNSPYFHDDIFFSNSGTPDVPDYRLDYDSEGSPYLKQVGVIPLYEQIQKSRSSCDLETVLKSTVADGQLNVIDSDEVNNLVADFTGLKTLGDVYTASKRLEGSWLDLPLEVREQFGSSMHKFITMYGTEEGSKLIQEGYKNYKHNISLVNKITQSGSLSSIKPDLPKPDLPKPDVPKPDVPNPNDK